MKVEFHHIDNTADPHWEEWQTIYCSSFPIEEQRPIESIERLIAGEERFDAQALLHDGRCIGLLTSWQFDTFIYIEHFAVAPKLRSSGYGSKALREFIDTRALPIVLEAEPPTDPMAIRRIGFYERNGFVLYDYDYYQPPYSPDRQGIPLQLMGNIPEDEARPDKIARTLHREVYGVRV